MAYFQIVVFQSNDELDQGIRSDYQIIAESKKSIKKKHFDNNLCVTEKGA